MDTTLSEKQKSLAQLLKARRKLLRLAQNEAGEALGVSQASYSAWELGKSVPTLDKLPALANFLGYEKSSELMNALENKATYGEIKVNQLAKVQRLIDAMPLEDLAVIGVDVSRKLYGALASGESNS